MAHMMEEQDENSSKKRKLETSACEGGVAGGTEEENAEGGGEGGSDGRRVIFKYLTPSDLRLTPEALVSTKVSHFRCNVNGCPRFSLISHLACACAVSRCLARNTVAVSWARCGARNRRVSFAYVLTQGNNLEDPLMRGETRGETRRVSSG